MGNKKSLTSISKLIETHTFVRGEGSIDLDIDIDSFTEDYFRGVGERQKARVKERRLKEAADAKKRDEEEARVKAEFDKAMKVREQAALDHPDDPLPEIPDLTMDNLERTLEVVTLVWERTALALEDQKTLRIDMLLGGDETPQPGCILVGWDAEYDDGEPAPLTATNLRKLSIKSVEDIWDFCQEKARTVKKTLTPAVATTIPGPENNGRVGTFSRSTAG